MKLTNSSCQQLMHIALMTDIKNDPVSGHIKYPVNGQCQLHNPQIGCQMASTVGNRINQSFTDLLCKVFQFLIGKIFNVFR